jgi:hypothetical protein
MKSILAGCTIVAVMVGFALLGSEKQASAGYGCHGPTPAAGCAGVALGGHEVYGCSGYSGPMRSILRRGVERRQDRRARRYNRRMHRRAARFAATCSAPATCAGPS